MCKRVDCDKCSKPTWKGCGRHIEEALQGVPEDERCKCPRESCATKESCATTVANKTEETTMTCHEVKCEETKAEIPTKSEVKTEETKTKED